MEDKHRLNDTELANVRGGNETLAPIPTAGRDDIPRQTEVMEHKEEEVFVQKPLPKINIETEGFKFKGWRDWFL